MNNQGQEQINLAFDNDSSFQAVWYTPYCVKSPHLGVQEKTYFSPARYFDEDIYFSYVYKISANHQGQQISLSFDNDLSFQTVWCLPFWGMSLILGMEEKILLFTCTLCSSFIPDEFTWGQLISLYPSAMTLAFEWSNTLSFRR